MRIFPLRSAAETIASASSGVSAIGFSRKTCLPAANALLGELAMERRRQADVDRVDLRIAMAASRSVVSSAPTTLGHPGCPLGRPRRDRLDADAVAERLVVARREPAP